MINTIINEDCFNVFNKIKSKSIDLIICDLPYGCTQNKWDSQLDLIELWKNYNRIIKDNGAIILFGQNSFSAKLILSNEKNFRYSIIWQKTTPTGHLNAKRMPLRIHEDILVFYKKLPLYNPQKTKGHKPVNKYTKHQNDGSNYGKTKTGISGGGSTERYPTSIITFKTDKQKSSIHPTQKPVKLIEYLLKTFSNQGEVILDNCSGSGTTAIACLNTLRNFICIEKNEKYYKESIKRLSNEINRL